MIGTQRAEPRLLRVRRRSIGGVDIGRTVVASASPHAQRADFSVVTSRYDEIACQYDSIYAQNHFIREDDIVAEMLAQMVGFHDRVLDVGCGTGKALELLPRHASYSGVDISREMLAKAGQKFPKVEFILAEAEDLPFADDSFDFAVSTFGSLSHVEDIERVVDELARVLSGTGRFCIMLYGLDRAKSSGQAKSRIVDYVPRALGAPNEYSIPAWLYSKRDVARMFRRRFGSVRVRGLTLMSRGPRSDLIGRAEHLADGILSQAFPDQAHTIVVTGQVEPRRAI